MLDSPHTSAPMLMRGTSLPQAQRDFHPANHVKHDIHPTDNHPPLARRSGAGEARRRVGRRRGRLTSSVRQSLSALVMQSSAPAPMAQSTWDSALGYRGQHLTHPSTKPAAEIRRYQGSGKKLFFDGIFSFYTTKQKTK